MLTRPLPSWCLLAPVLTCPLHSWHLQAWTLKYLLLNLALRRVLHSNAHFPSLASVGTCIHRPNSPFWPLETYTLMGKLQFCPQEEHELTCWLLCSLQVFLYPFPVTLALCRHLGSRSTCLLFPLHALALTYLQLFPGFYRQLHAYTHSPLLVSIALALTCSVPIDLCIPLHELSHCTSLYSRDTCTHKPMTVWPVKESAVTCQQPSSRIDMWLQSHIHSIHFSLPAPTLTCPMPTYVLCQQASYLTCLSRTGPCALKPLTHHHETAGTYTQSSKLNSALGLHGLTSTLPSCGIGRDQDSHAYCAHFYSPGKTLTGTFLTSELCKMCNYKIHDGLCRHLHSHAHWYQALYRNTYWHDHCKAALYTQNFICLLLSCIPKKPLIHMTTAILHSREIHIHIVTALLHFIETYIYMPTAIHEVYRNTYSHTNCHTAF